MEPAGSDKDDGRAAGQLRAADARRLEPVLAVVEPKLARIALPQAWRVPSSASTTVQP